MTAAATNSSSARVRKGPGDEQRVREALIEWYIEAFIGAAMLLGVATFFIAPQFGRTYCIPVGNLDLPLRGLFLLPAIVKLARLLMLQDGIKRVVAKTVARATMTLSFVLLAYGTLHAGIMKLYTWTRSSFFEIATVLTGGNIEVTLEEAPKSSPGASGRVLIILFLCALLLLELKYELFSSVLGLGTSDAAAPENAAMPTSGSHNRGGMRVNHSPAAKGPNAVRSETEEGKWSELMDEIAKLRRDVSLLLELQIDNKKGSAAELW